MSTPISMRLIFDFLISIKPNPMMIVPGSIPKIIFDAFCKGLLIFTLNILLEQKYKINHQLRIRAIALYYIVLCNIQASCFTIRFIIEMEPAEKQLA